MEFYLWKGTNRKGRKGFQFPTGWNSTVAAGLSRTARYVSIPNGMEFYSMTADLAFVIGGSFNSQRDGILPNCWWKTQRERNVSIPNGMEFYSIWCWYIADDVCFNSQRDGILLYPNAQPDVNTKFQFPTGWNSTRRIRSSICSCRVSIPNGMEFYVKKKAVRVVVQSFQFPTGWNSTRRNTAKSPRKDVSIPNGMEFYSGLYSIDENEEEFQFPTGWNSTIAFWSATTPNCVSIPNGMEFYWKHTARSLLRLRFNSQRDGILRYASNQYLAEKLFQFPTGWNSTERARSETLGGRVSIPNGMEFYQRVSEP